MRKTMFVMVALVLLVAACVPVENQQDLESRVNTAVAQTREAENQVSTSVAQTVEAQSPSSTPTSEVSQTPTETPLAFPTFTPIISTITPLPINPTSTRRASQQAEYACNAISRKPFDNTEYNKGAKFDIKWTIINTGTKTWPAGVDVKYYSGPKMTTTSRVEIPVEMEPNDTYVVNLDAVAPDKKGFHVMTWAVDGPMCFPYTAIVVK
ncbi:MAG: hypothetical protein HYZ21_09230 [Chloroflexi bacterium]|nr:hypothetical protein [Chloroflexota bacterium]